MLGVIVGVTCDPNRLSEMALGDLLVFLRRVASSAGVRTALASTKWTSLLISIIEVSKDTGKSTEGTMFKDRQLWLEAYPWHSLLSSFIFVSQRGIQL